MKVNEILERSSAPPISYEIIPPQRGGTVEEIFAIIDDLAPYEPPFIDMTSHAAQVNYEEMPDGSWRRRVKRKRPGTIGLCAAIQFKYGIEAVPHLLCRGFTREETEDALIELHYLGVRNVMALRGDDSGFEKPIPPSRSVNRHAEELVEQIHQMNNGRYLEELIDAAPTDFCIGVAGYPEKHFEAPNLKHDVLSLKRKMDAGAHYVTTQMFFDNAHYFRFVDECRAAGIEAPIIPGLKIITSQRHLKTLPSRFFVNLPEGLADEVAEARPEHVADVGVEWAIRQTEELLDGGAPGIHFYIMKTSRHVLRVVDHLRKVA